MDSKLRAVLAEIRKSSRWAIAIRDHDVNDWSLLPFRKGDIIEVIEKEEDSGWFKGETSERNGWFPKESIEILFGKPTPKQVEDAKLRLNVVAPPPPRPASPPPTPPPSKPPPSVSMQDLAKVAMPASEPLEDVLTDLPDLSEPRELRERSNSSNSGSNPGSMTDLTAIEDPSAFTIFEYAKLYFKYEIKGEEDFNSRGSMKGTLKKLKVPIVFCCLFCFSCDA